MSKLIHGKKLTLREGVMVTEDGVYDGLYENDKFSCFTAVVPCQKNEGMSDIFEVVVNQAGNTCLYPVSEGIHPENLESLLSVRKQMGDVRHFSTEEIENFRARKKSLPGLCAKL